MKLEQVYITQQAVRKKEIHKYFLKIMCWEIFKPFINLLSENLRHLGPKNGSSNFLDLLYLAWLSRYKSTIERDFSHQWRKTIVAVEGLEFLEYAVSSSQNRHTHTGWLLYPRYSPTAARVMTTKVLSSRPHTARPITHNYSILPSRSSFSSLSFWYCFSDNTLVVHSLLVYPIQ